MSTLVEDRTQLSKIHKMSLSGDGERSSGNGATSDAPEGEGGAAAEATALASSDSATDGSGSSVNCYPHSGHDGAGLLALHSDGPYGCDTSSVNDGIGENYYHGGGAGDYDDDAGMGAAVDTYVTANDLCDRERLLQHVTQLSTALQRARLQVEEQQRTITLLHAVAESRSSLSSLSPAASGGGGRALTVELCGAGATAAVLAAQEEAEVREALEAAAAAFDPVLAQEQLARLDTALARVTLLRRAELQRLQRAEAELADTRAARNALVEQLEAARTHGEAAQRRAAAAEAALTTARLEADRLREEEAHLSRQLVGMRALAADSGDGGVRVSRATAPAAAGAASAGVRRSLAALEEEEQRARQEVLQGLFWGPMLIAFDAGLTWVADVEAAAAAEAEAEADGQQEQQRQRTSASGPPEAEESRHSSTARAEGTEALLRRQEEELTALRVELHRVAERQRLSAVEAERYRTLFESERRRCEQDARDHAAQLHRAYEELVKDRRLIMQALRADVEEQVRAAFAAGRQYERQSPRHTRGEAEGGEGGEEASGPSAAPGAQSESEGWGDDCDGAAAVLSAAHRTRSSRVAASPAAAAAAGTRVGSKRRQQTRA